MPRIEIYVQLTMSAEVCGVLSEWDASGKEICQQLANDMNSEVRAIQGDTELARFCPQPKAQETEGSVE